SIPVPPHWLCVSCRTLHANRTRKGVIQAEEQTECREMELRLVEYADWGVQHREHRGRTEDTEQISSLCPLCFLCALCVNLNSPYIQSAKRSEGYFHGCRMTGGGGGVTRCGGLRCNSSNRYFTAASSVGSSPCASASGRSTTSTSGSTPTPSTVQ